MDLITKIRYDNTYDVGDDEFNDRLQAYKTTFSGDFAETVLRDLVQYCRYNDDEITSDGILNAHKQGLQSVINHIHKMLNTTKVDYEIED